MNIKNIIINVNNVNYIDNFNRKWSRDFCDKTFVFEKYDVNVYMLSQTDLNAQSLTKITKKHIKNKYNKYKFKLVFEDIIQIYIENVDLLMSLNFFMKKA